MIKFFKLSITILLLLQLFSCSDDSTVDKDQSIPLESTSIKDKTSIIPDGALSDLAYPTYYTLDLIIDPNQEVFTGHAKLDIDLNRESNGIWLHGKDLRVASVIVATADGQVHPASYSQKSDSGTAWVDFGQSMAAGKLSIIFDYQADFNRNLSGLFKVEEQGDAYVLAKSESIQARKYLPGFDQPGFKSPYKISMTIPKGMVAISNTREISTDKVENNQVKFQFAETRSMPTYLLSIAAGPFDVIEFDNIPTNEIRDFEIPLRAVARKGRAKDMSFVMGITAEYMRLFEQALAQPYPFKKLDIVAAPQWPSGATELSAAITYREQRVLLGDDPAPGAKLSIMNTHAHEIAHMWFGNLVTPPWWDDLWLKEGFSTWATPVILEQFEPGVGHALNAIRSNFNTMGKDSLASTRAIRQPILKDANIRNAYDGITYRKSQAVIHMIDSYFGAEKFRKALGSYVAQYADGVADSPQFYKSIGEQTGEPALTETFRQFVEQKGVPQMDTNVQCLSNQPTRVSFSQSRYRPLGSPINSNPEWTVPMCVGYKIDNRIEKTCGLVSPKTNVLELDTKQCPQWVMPNANGAGYYRWTLPSDQLNALFDGYSSLSEGEKIALLDSVFAGYEAGKVDHELMLKATHVSSLSTLRPIVEFPLSKMSYYINDILQQTVASETIQLITPWYLDKIATLESKLNKRTDAEQLLLNNITKFAANTLKHQPLRQKLKSKAEAFVTMALADKKANDQAADKMAKVLSSDLYTTAFTIAVEEIGEDFFNQLIEARKILDNPLFDNSSAAALGAIRDVEVRNKAQAYALSEDIGSRESFSMIYNMLDNQELGNDHWQWFTKNLSAILKKVPAQWRRRSPRFAGVLCESSRLEEVDQLFAKHADEAPGHELALKQTKESIVLCAALKAHMRK